VAIKVLPASVASDPKRLSRFEREAKAVAALNHENIVTIHTIGSEAGVHYLAMELVEGETLDRRIGPDGLPAGELLRLAVPIVSALAAAHAKGVVHRDLKPGNVMVTHEGKVKVLDFGLAKLMHASDEEAPSPGDATMSMAADLKTQDGAVVGTMPYMSPEQVSGKPVGPASDLFSVGVLLYEMATGSRPFKGETGNRLISSILTDVPAPAVELRPDLPEVVGGVIAQCLAKDPGGRPSSAEQLRRDLLALQTAVSGHDVPVAAAARNGRPMNRTGVLVVFALVAVVATVAGWKMIGDQPAGRTPSMMRMAILPFADDGSEQAAFVSRGLVDEVNLRLAGLRALAMVPIEGTETFRGSDLSPREIGDELEVQYLVTGSVRYGDGGLVVEPNLIRVADEELVWSDAFTVPVRSVERLQSDISHRVVRALGVALSEKEKDRLAMRSTADPVAYEAFLRGVEVQPVSHDSESDYRHALTLFEQAVKLDPEFALAWVKAAHNHLQLYWLGYDRTEARLALATEALDRAEAIAPGLADIHLQRGYLYYHGYLDFDKALAELSLAAKDIPNDPVLVSTIGYIWRRQGMFEQAIPNLERYQELTPFDPYQNIELAYTRICIGDYEGVFETIDQTLAFDPDYDWAYMLAGFAYWHRGAEGDLDRARVAFARHPDPRDDYPAWFVILQHIYDRDFAAAHARIANLAVPMIKLQSFLAPRGLLSGMVYLAEGKPEQARPEFASALAVLEPMLEELPDDHRLFSALGLAHAGLGHREEALRYGRKAVEIYPSAQDALMGPDRIWDLARIHLLLGDEEAALDQIATLLSHPSHYSAAWLKLDPILDTVRDHPRFAMLMK
jgi:TolB-like protein/Tfp pilus assembly protein PilF